MERFYCQKDGGQHNVKVFVELDCIPEDAGGNLAVIHGKGLIAMAQTSDGEGIAVVATSTLFETEQ